MQINESKAGESDCSLPNKIANFETHFDVQVLLFFKYSNYARGNVGSNETNVYISDIVTAHSIIGLRGPSSEGIPQIHHSIISENMQHA